MKKIIKHSGRCQYKETDIACKIHCPFSAFNIKNDSNNRCFGREQLLESAKEYLDLFEPEEIIIEEKNVIDRNLINNRRILIC